MLALLLLPLLWAGSLQEHPEFKLQLRESVTVQAGLCTLVSCSFSYPWSGWYPPSKVYIYWFRDGDSVYYNDPVATNHPKRAIKTETKDRFLLLGDVSTTNCSLSIRDARMEDSGSYFLRADIGNIKHIYTDKNLTLQVTALTQKPVIHFLEPLEFGRPAHLSCSLPGSCEGGRPILFSWVGAVTDSMDPQALHSSVLSLTPRPQDHGTNLTCQVKRQGAEVTTEIAVQLNVSYAPQNFSIGVAFRIGTALPEGLALQLHCAADGNPSAQLSWSRGSPTRNASRISHTGILDLPGVEAAEGEAFTCLAQNALGSQNVSVSLSYPPQLLGPSCSWEAEGLCCSCSSRGWPAPSLRWRLGQELLEGNSSRVTSSAAGPWANSSLSLHEGISAGLNLSCEAQNAQGTQRATVLLLPGKSASRTEVLLAALGGAGAGVLLSLGLCLVFCFIVKPCRKLTPGKAENVDGKDPVMGTVPWPQPDSTSDPVCPAGDGDGPREQQEPHYASLNFHWMKSEEPQDREALNSTEYSEIKTSQ